LMGKGEKKATSTKKKGKEPTPVPLEKEKARTPKREKGPEKRGGVILKYSRVSLHAE